MKNNQRHVKEENEDEIKRTHVIITLHSQWRYRENTTIKYIKQEIKNYISFGIN